MNDCQVAQDQIETISKILKNIKNGLKKWQVWELVEKAG